MQHHAVHSAAALFFLILPGFILFSLVFSSVSAAEVSIGTIIDTVGMVTDRTTVQMASEDSIVNGSVFYRDGSQSNGGSFKETKAVSFGKASSPDTLTAQKVISYDSSHLGGHVVTSEAVGTTGSGSTDSSTQAPCILSTSGASGGSGKMASAGASLDIGAETLRLSTSTRVAPGELQYTVAANTSLASSNTTSPATVRSSFTYNTATGTEQTQMSDRTLISGLLDLFTRSYFAGERGEILAQTGASGMVSTKTVAQQEIAGGNVTGVPEGWYGSTVYSAELLTNGGRASETKTLSVDETLDSQRVLTYLSDGSSAMQAREIVIASKESSAASSGSAASSCVLAPPGADSNSSTTSYQAITASSQLLGVSSAESETVTRVDLGSKRNGTDPLHLEYRADITSPLIFDTAILASMTDPDQDGRYEDINGNGRLDMQDLVRLFDNLEEISKSSVSERFDYNSNGRVDFADLILIFRKIEG
ncbi:MAG TPA: dockerin type I domain-containing protein [Methanospirillum sp.]|nr:dockerin type I domain-containing protein [Methanospirillum sp.]